MMASEAFVAALSALLGVLAAELRRWAAKRRRVALPEDREIFRDQRGHMLVGCRHLHHLSAGVEHKVSPRGAFVPIWWCPECGALRRGDEEWCPPTNPECPVSDEGS